MDDALRIDSFPVFLGTDAELALAADDALSATAAEEQRRYVTNYIGFKQKLIDFIWENTPDGVAAVAGSFSGSPVLGHVSKGNGRNVSASDTLWP